METAKAGPERRQTIAMAVSAELERQARDGATRIDIEALAEAVDVALDMPAAAGEGRRPQDLNATNDD
jgi:hypothetical protein